LKTEGVLLVLKVSMVSV